MANKTVELNTFFSTTNQDEGMWFEPKINGEGIGIEFKVTGKESLKNEYSREVYAKDLDKIVKDNPDPLERLEKTKKRMAEQTASYVVGIRGVAGVNVLMDGKPLEFSLEAVTKLFYENFNIQTQVLDFSFNIENFMNRKK